MPAHQSRVLVGRRSQARWSHHSLRPERFIHPAGGLCPLAVSSHLVPPTSRDGGFGPNWPEFKFFCVFGHFPLLIVGVSISNGQESLSKDMGKTRGKQGCWLFRVEHMHTSEGGQKPAQFGPFPVRRCDWRCTSGGCWAIPYQPDAQARGRPGVALALRT